MRKGSKKSIDLDGGDQNFSWFLGLLHDIGRFEQVKRFGTFSDIQSVDHAGRGGDEEGIDTDSGHPWSGHKPFSSDGI